MDCVELSLPGAYGLQKISVFLAPESTPFEWSHSRSGMEAFDVVPYFCCLC